MNATEIGLYLHIPFCDHICGYCDFFTVYRKTSSSVYERFTNALIREIELRADENWGKQKIKTIYFGGGTPSILKTSQLGKILKTISTKFDTSTLAECSIEINPGTTTLEDLLAYQQMGINRASFGVQAFQDDVLKSADRIHDASQAISAIRLAQKAGFMNISLDLMFGIPGQSKQDWRHSLRKAIELNVQHISLYNLTYEKGTPFFKQKQNGTLNPVEEETEEWFYEYAVDEMENSLFQRYEISNFSLPGFESKHNSNYWDLVPYLGVGPSAHSFDGQRRFWNVNHFLKYLRNLEGDEIPVAKTEHLTEIMNLEEWIFLQLRQVKGFSFTDLKDRFDISVSDWKKELSGQFGPEWQKWIKIDIHTLSLTKEGMRVSESIYPVIVDWFEEIFN